MLLVQGLARHNRQAQVSLDVHVIAFAVFGVIVIGWLTWLTLLLADLHGIRDDVDQATDDADKAVRAVDQVIDHLAEHDTSPGSGRHH